jgi:molybdate transport system permease protein
MRFQRLTILAAFAVLVIYGLLIASLFYFFDGATVLAAWSSKRVLFAIQLSLVAATVATASRAFHRVRPPMVVRFRFRGRQAVDAILEFPIIVSPAALGAIILIFFSNPVGTWIQENTIQFVFAFAGIVLAQFISILGVAVRFMKSAFDQVPVNYETVAVAWARLLRAPLDHRRAPCRRGLSRGVSLGLRPWGRSAPPSPSPAPWPCGTETLPIGSYMHLASADIEGTVALILVLLAIGLGALYAAKFLFRERRADT